MRLSSLHTETLLPSEFQLFLAFDEVIHILMSISVIIVMLIDLDVNYVC